MIWGWRIIYTRSNDIYTYRRYLLTLWGRKSGIRVDWVERRKASGLFLTQTFYCLALIAAGCVHIIKETKMAQNKKSMRDKIAALKNQGLEDYLDGKKNKNKPTGKKGK